MAGLNWETGIMHGSIGKWPVNQYVSRIHSVYLMKLYCLDDNNGVNYRHYMVSVFSNTSRGACSVG